MKTLQRARTPQARPAPQVGTFRDAFLRGMAQRPKSVPCKFLYDEAGSRLFDRICTLEEYYPTRTETAILQERTKELCRVCGPDCLLIELGSGSSAKTRLLLDHLSSPAAYMPIDISREALLQAAAELNEDYPDLPIVPVWADYNRLEILPECWGQPRRNVVFFPGSTIGNFEPADAMRFLRHVSVFCGADGALVVGVDLRKAPEVLHRAYNDREGVTAAFNLNLLARANRELGADFNLARFRHQAVYNERKSRIEMRLISLAEQTVHCGGRPIPFAPGEFILTEYSHKYSVDSFANLARAAGYEPTTYWTDERQWFAVFHLRVAST